MTRSLEAAARDTRGDELASSAVMMARRVDSAILWLSLRLRPGTPFSR